MKVNHRIVCIASLAAALLAASAGDLPEDGIYPNGKKLAFMGYSGNPARDLTNGFTVAGPVYGKQDPYLEQCFKAGFPVVVQVGLKTTFADKAPNKYKMDEPSLRAEVASQVKAVAGHKEVVWWAIQPEELRPWRRDEIRYLEIVAATIRTNDPLHRPVFLYNPNHRDAASLKPIAAQVDILGKGTYVNSVGKKRNRSWVRWSIEQELAAAATSRRDPVALLMPELCGDPHPDQDREIRSWVRHDVYLGLCSGAKGVLIWSLFKRKEVQRSWQLWYDAYAECGRELNGEKALGQVFLFGEPDGSVKVRSTAAAGKVVLGGSDEVTTTSEVERAKREVAVPDWTAKCYRYRDAIWLFLVNSANTPTSFEIAGWPVGARAESCFTGKPVALPGQAPLRLELRAYGVEAIRFVMP